MSDARVKSMSSGRLTVAYAIASGGVAAAGDLELAARRVGALHRGDVVDLGHLGEHLLHRGLDRGVGHALVGLEDDLARLRGAAAVVELRLDEREALGRLEALEREVLAVGVADAAGDAVADEQSDDPERRARACGDRGTTSRGG